MRNLFLLIMILTFIACTSVFAQQATAPVQVTKTTIEENTAPATSSKPRFDVGVGYWYTTSKMDSKVLADTDLPGLYLKGDKISELKNDLDAGLIFINAEAYLFWRIYADGFIAWGDFDGEHKDYDWFPQISTDTWSLSKSDADGDVITWNANGYFRILEEPNNKGFLDVSLGYFYYRDDIEHLQNSTLLIYNWETVDIPIEGHDSQLKYTFDGLRLGARANIRLHDRVAVKLGGGICPWAKAKEHGYWNLREMDFDCEADAKVFDLSLGVELKITKFLFIEAGYKYINLDSSRGDDKRTWSDGSKATYEDAFEADGNRGGFYAMGRLKI